MPSTTDRRDPGFGAAEIRNATILIGLALEEDLGTSGDITARLTIPDEARGKARFVARKPGVVAGLPIVEIIAERLGSVAFRALARDGDEVRPGTELGEIEGSMRGILALERTALNFLQRLSGVATMTARFVREVQGTRASILDTRKTTPGWRYLEKYAVRAGGGRNHRIGLFDAVLVKDNHLAWLGIAGDGAVTDAVRKARAGAPAGTLIEIEVDTFDQLKEALAVGPDVVLVDNFNAENLAKAVQLRDRLAPSVLLEVSGGVGLETVAGLARTGVERISVGALTHSAPALDIGLDYVA